MAVDWLRGGQFWIMWRASLKGFWKKASHSLKESMEEMTLFFRIVIYGCDALNCSNHEGRPSENRTSMFTMAEGEMERMLPGKSCWIHQPLGLTYSGTHFMEENKISYKFSFSPRHPDSHSMYTYFYSTQDLTTVVGFYKQRRVVTGNQCAG